MNKLRPSNFSEFVGQANLMEILQVYCQICKQEKTCFKHCLFYGLPGTGKTSLAYVIGNELKVKVHYLNANNLHTQADLLSFFSLINDNEIVFIDELHSLDPKIVEFLYSMMEDFFIDIPIGKEFNKKSTHLKIPHFSLIGATTSIGRIPKPLLERFHLVYKLQDYTISEIKQIIKQVININIKQVNLLTDEEITSLSEHCKNNPRIGINLLHQVIDFKKINPKTNIEEIWKKLRIFLYGLTISDLEYLQTINNCQHQVLGIKTICQITGYDSFTIENYIEPFLFKLELLTKTSKGRALTKKGQNLLNQLKLV